MRGKFQAPPINTESPAGNRGRRYGTAALLCAAIAGFVQAAEDNAAPVSVDAAAPVSSQPGSAEDVTTGSVAVDIEKLLANLDPTSDEAMEAVPVLLAALRNPESDSTVRERSAKLLARIGEPARHAVPTLIDLLKQPGPASEKNQPVTGSKIETDVRYWTMKSLGVFGSVAADAVPTIRQLLESPQTSLELRVLAADTLGQIRSPAAVGVLTTELMKSHSSDSLLRLTMIDSLGLCGPQAVGAVPALARATEDSNATIRRKACAAIGALGPRAESGTASLMERLVLDEDPAVKDAAASALAQLGASSVPSLIELLEQGGPELQWRAARALGQIGNAAEATQTALERSFENSTNEVRIEAVDAVWKITRDPNLVAAPLMKELATDDRQIRRRAAQLLIELNPLPAETLAALSRISETGNSSEARAAAYVIRERARKTDQ